MELPSDDRAKLRKLMARIRGSFGEPRCCYEASSCGYTLYRTLSDDGVALRGHCTFVDSTACR